MHHHPALDVGHRVEQRHGGGSAGEDSGDGEGGEKDEVRAGHGAGDDIRDPF